MPSPPTARGTPRRRPASGQDRTRDRILAVIGVATLLVVFVLVVSLIAGAGGSGASGETAGTSADATRTPAATPTSTPTPRPTPVPLTAAQRAERQAAADVVASRGFRVQRLRDWDPEDTLRVLIGRSGTGGRMAFFFVNGDYVGNDSSYTSARLTVRGTRDLAATLRYRTYVPGDAPDRPSGDRVDVRFRWDGTRLTPLEPVPPPEERTPGRQIG